MKYINWNNEKNKQLKEERKLSFEDVLYYIENEKILDIIMHPNEERYKNQKIFIIEIEAYVYLIPFVENNEEIFLKTIIPSRKMTKRYLGEFHEEK